MFHTWDYIFVCPHAGIQWWSVVPTARGTRWEGRSQRRWRTQSEQWTSWVPRSTCNTVPSPGLATPPVAGCPRSAITCGGGGLNAWCRSCVELKWQYTEDWVWWSCTGTCIRGNSNKNRQDLSRASISDLLTCLERNGTSYQQTNRQLYVWASCRKRQSEICIQIGKMVSYGYLSISVQYRRAAFTIRSARLLAQDHGVRLYVANRWPALDKPPIRRKDWIYVTWVQSSIVIRELRSHALLIASITTECVGLPLCNVRFLYAYFQATVRSHTEPEVLRVQNLHAL